MRKSPSSYARMRTPEELALRTLNFLVISLRVVEVGSRGSVPVNVGPAGTKNATHTHFRHAHTHTHTHTYIHMCIQTDMQNLHIHANIHTRVHTYMHTHIHIHIHMYIHAYTYPRTSTHIPKNIHMPTDLHVCIMLTGDRKQHYL